MSIKTPPLFPIFSTPHHHHHQHNRRITLTITNFSKWNNANAEPFNRRLRTQKLIEDDIRRSRKFRSIDKISHSHQNSSVSPFRSLGTPSQPSRSSIPGKKSKYSKPEPINTYKYNHNSYLSHTSTKHFLEIESKVPHGFDQLPIRDSVSSMEFSEREVKVRVRDGDGDGDAIKVSGNSEVRVGVDDVDDKAFGNYRSESCSERTRIREREIRAVDVKESGYSVNSVFEDNDDRELGTKKDLAMGEFRYSVFRDSGNGVDDDVATKNDVEMGAFRYSGDSVVRDSGNGVDDDVAMGAFRYSGDSVVRGLGNGVDDDVAENYGFGNAGLLREEGKRFASNSGDGDADVAVKASENSTVRRLRSEGSDDGKVAVKESKYSGNVKTLGSTARRFRDGERRVKALRDGKPSHPAFRRFKDSVRGAKISKFDGKDKESNMDGEGVRVCEDGVSYMVGGAPFEFMYSYTETPKVKPVRLREPPVAPFGPTTMARPWTGRKPLAKKKLPEFDSFRLPPPHKKGVKPVQSPGPFLPGSGPKYVHSREEILGEPLSKAEIEDVVNGCRKSRRQMHMGRDGLTHNMLENIHAHWKRRRVCKIKCLGVCTVDMDNVRQQLEDKTGGKVIYGSGGVIYLFRGRNYNYMTRPRYPLMLWKPITPVYPRLIQRVPDGLTLEEASEMRKKGRDLIPICKLGKNGVYTNLVKDVKEAFEACDLVRINCQGMNSSDYHKIGAKLKDLVPCVLISFEREHILMWRGKEWASSLPKLGDTPKIENSEYDVTLSPTADSEDEGISTSFSSDSEDESISISIPDKDCSTSSLGSDSILRTDGINGNENLNTVDDHSRDTIKLSSLWAEGVRSLLKEAIDNGAAIILDNSSLDSDIVFQTALGLSKSAPPGLVFKDRRRKVVVQKPEKPKTEALKVEEVLMIQDNKRESAKKSSYKRELVMEGVETEYVNVVPQGILRVDELAKLLA